MYRTRIFESPERSFFLFGPRGSGKSTWIRHSVNAVKTFDLLSEELYQRLLVTPGAFAAELRIVEAGSWVVVDEIQRIPALLNEVHRFIEERQLRFVLSGSSARKLKQAGVNLLAGRAVRRYLHPFVPEEIGIASRWMQRCASARFPLYGIKRMTETGKRRCVPTHSCI
jgi:predicted AAA+ superfamily ATPase